MTLKDLSKILLEINLPKNDIKRIYRKGKTMVGIDLCEHATHPAADLTATLAYRGNSNVQVFTYGNSRYREDYTTLYESVVDAEKRMLNPSLWTKNTLNIDVKALIIDTVTGLVESFNKKTGLDIVLKDIYITGSNLGYYYNSYTDLDTHFSIQEFSDDIQSLMASHINDTVKDTLFIDKHILEFYLMSSDQEGRENGIYDVQNDKWIATPEKVALTPDQFNACNAIAMHYARSFDMMTGELRRDIIEYRLQDDLEDELSITQKQPEIVRSLKWNEIKANTDAIVLAFDAIKQLRTDSFEDDFKQSDVTVTDIQSSLERSYTTNNVVFKILDRYGYIPLAKKFKHGIHKAMLADDSLDVNRDMYVDQISNVLKVDIGEVE